MDGHFVPNLTFGWKTIEAVRAVTALPFDAHLMIAEPGRWTDEFLDAGCDSITFHVEVEAPQIRPALARIREAGRSAGLSVKPGTPLAALDAYRDLLDIVLVMTVEPGFGGQSFMADVADGEAGPGARDGSIRPARARSRSTAAAGAETAEAIGRGGTDVIVAGSALYRAADMAAEVERIRAIAEAAPPADARRLARHAGARPAPARHARRGPGRRRGDGRHRPRAPGVPRRRPRRRRGDRRRAGPPDLRAADLRGRGRADEPLAAGHRRRGPRREPVHALRGHPPRPAARVHRRRAARARGGAVAPRRGRDRGAGRPDGARPVRGGDGGGARERRPVHDLARHRRRA